MKKSLLSTVLLFGIAGAGVAQTQINPCVTYNMQEYYSQTLPGYKEKLKAVNEKAAQEFEAYKQSLIHNNQARSASAIPASYTFTIPVVFHILHTNGPENVADALCISALDQVNRDYGRQGSDVNAIDPLYEPLYVDSKMKFVLAKKDPYGNCTTGIIHHYDENTQWGRDMNAYKYSTIGTYNWSPSRYLNIYVVNDIASSGSGQTIGYTFLPGTSPNVGSDAIVYNRSFLIGNNGCGDPWARSLSHEIGHWFGLSHTFGSSNEAGKTCGNDDIYDTPATKGFFSNCPPYITLDDSCDIGHRSNINNIMDYSGVPKMFTQGQTDKIRFTAQNSTANRNYLVDTANLVFTGILSMTATAVTNTLTGTTDTVKTYGPAPTAICGPVADFYANRAKSCHGQTVIYNSTSFGNTAGLTYAWTFDGGVPATSTLANPSVVYAMPGSYSTTLTVTNAAGTSTKVRSPFLTTNWHVDQSAVPAKEGFEGTEPGGLLPAGWSVVNKDYGTITWQPTNVGLNSSKCMVLPNANGNMAGSGDVDILETNQYNFSNISAIVVSYDYSYAKKPGATGDAFRFEYSLDCGGNWTALTGSALSVSPGGGGTLTAPHIPYGASKWTNKVYSVPTLNNKPDVKFRFVFTNTEQGNAQNLYLDNFNISGTVGLAELENAIGLSIYPNPTSASSTIEFSSPVDAKVAIHVFDVAGRMVEENSFNAAAGNLTKYDVNKNALLKPGIYFVTLNLNGQKVTKKLIVE